MDNICAIATAYGAAAISVIRTSGPDCINLVQKVFDRKIKDKGYTITYGNIVAGGNIIDEVLVSVFKAPHSFDGCDSVEISCHGGVFVTNLVLETLLDAGFRLAEGGEFTKRAYLNKKMDLTESEAVMDIISASNKKALLQANRSLHSYTRNLIRGLREEILNLIASIEVNIDYPEYDDAVYVDNEILLPKLNEITFNMEEILKRSRVAKVVREGVNVCIVGKPNVGKSSILNMLLDEEKAIVSNVAGTTRDLVDGYVTLGNVTLHFIDTAGIHESDDLVESIGIKRSKEAIDKSDIVFVVVDSSKELDEYDLEILEITKNKPRIIIGNKCDLDNVVNIEDIIYVSAKDKLNLDLLTDEIIKLTKVNEFDSMDGNYLANSRHIHLMKVALNSLYNAINACKLMVDSSLVEIDIKDAFNALGLITGEAYDDELIDSLFSKFCLGK